MNQPTISILIPTRGGGDLSYVLQTISTQELIDGDEIIIIGDGPQPEIAAQINALGPPYRYVQTEKPTSDFGHSQLNYGLSLARGDYIMCQDDDDGYLPRAIEVVRAALVENPGKPLLFKFWTNDRYLVWNESFGKRIEEMKIGGHNLVLPNVAGKVGEFGPRYRGDFDWVRSVLAYYPENEWGWRPEILTRQRPNRVLQAWPVWKKPSGNWYIACSCNDFKSVPTGDNLTSKCPSCGRVYSHPNQQITSWPYRLEMLRRIRNECRNEMTHSQAEISVGQQVKWFSELDRNNNWAWLYTIKGGSPNEFIGFTYLRRRDGIMSFSYGLAEDYRNKGYGRHIFQHAMDACMGDATNDFFDSNERSKELHLAHGWRTIYEKDGIVNAHWDYPR